MPFWLLQSFQSLNFKQLSTQIYLEHIPTSSKQFTCIYFFLLAFFPVVLVQFWRQFRGSCQGRYIQELCANETEQVIVTLQDIFQIILPMTVRRISYYLEHLQSRSVSFLTALVGLFWNGERSLGQKMGAKRQRIANKITEGLVLNRSPKRLYSHFPVPCLGFVAGLVFLHQISI